MDFKMLISFIQQSSVEHLPWAKTSSAHSKKQEYEENIILPPEIYRLIREKKNSPPD
jgi:hypothetical protein